MIIVAVFVSAEPYSGEYNENILLLLKLRLLSKFVCGKLIRNCAFSHIYCTYIMHILYTNMHSRNI